VKVAEKIMQYLHVVKDFEERECHSTSDDHLVHFVQQILNQQNLVCHLCSAPHNAENNQYHTQQQLITDQFVIRRQ